MVSLILLLGGRHPAKDHVPPYPGEVLDTAGKVVFTKADIFRG